MSDTPPPADGWRQGPDGKWYGPEEQPPASGPSTPPPPPPPSKEPDGGWPTAAGQPKSTATTDSNTKTGCGVLIAVAVVLAVLASMCGGDDDESSIDDLRFGAFDVCTQFVKDRLKAPGTASFRNYFEEDGEVQVTGTGEGPYTVRSSVDSENGFGANIRTDFVCKVTHTGDGNWRLVDITVME